MFDFLKGNSFNDAKSVRNGILQFIKEQLQKLEGGEGSNIRGLCLYSTCKPHERYVYEGALYSGDTDRFREEVQKIADDYALDLPASWTLEIEYTEQPPTEAIKAKGVAVALFISTKKKPKAQLHQLAYIKVLNGETEKAFYTLQPGNQKITIGRERKTQTADGFYRENVIAFLNDSKNESNRSVSRQHGHLEWDADAGAFYIYADEGGIPPYNKLKVRTVGENPVKLQTTQIGHRLHEGDQIIVGESALLEFTYMAEETVSN